MPLEVHTSRLVLRVLSPADAPLVREYLLRSREWLEPWEPKRPDSYWDLASVEARLQQDLDATQSGHALTFHLAENTDPERIIGACNLRNVIRGAFLSCHLGYALAPDATGRGFMTEAIAKTVEIGFEELGLHRIEANVIPRNVASLAVLERCGFEREGLARDYLCIAGQWEDHVHMVRLNPSAACGLVG